MLKNFWRFIGAILIGGSLMLIGYKIFSGDPIAIDYSNKGKMFTDIQQWLIDLMGHAITGLIFMVTGAYVFLWGLIPNRTSTMMKIAGLISLAVAGFIVFYGYSMYHGITIDLGEDLRGRNQALQRIMIDFFESLQDSLGDKQAGMLFMGIGGIWGLLSIMAGLIKRPRVAAEPQEEDYSY